MDGVASESLVSLRSVKRRHDVRRVRAVNTEVDEKELASFVASVEPPPTELQTESAPSRSRRIRATSWRSLRMRAIISVSPLRLRFFSAWWSWVSCTERICFALIVRSQSTLTRLDR